MNEIKCEEKETINPSEYDFNDYNILMDCLVSFKYMNTLLGTLKTEASNDVLLKKVEQVGKKIETETRKTWDLMYKKGWYKVEVATKDKVNTTYKKFDEMKTELR